MEGYGFAAWSIRVLSVVSRRRLEDECPRVTPPCPAPPPSPPRHAPGAAAIRGGYIPVAVPSHRGGIT